jgi:arylsulfatase A-like enzyme
MKSLRLLGLLSLLCLIIYLVYFHGLKKPAPEKPLNVILISIDGLQAKHLAEYGYSLNTTPNLDSFIDKSYLFLNAISPSSWTVPTHMSIFTSMYPSEHKVVNKFLDWNPTTKTGTVANLKKLTPSAVTLAEIFKNNGYVTGGFTGDAGVGKQFGFGQGFDDYYDATTFGGFDNSMPKALDWLTKNKDNKFFLFLHGYDVHGQYAPPGGFDYRYVAKPYVGKYTGSPVEQAALREEGLKNGTINLTPQDVTFWRAIYDEKINRMDAEFGNFLGQVQKLGLMDNTVIIVFSDHGTEFYEHKRFDHGHTLYGELVDVLFTIHLPGQKDGKRITSLVSTLDIMPTILKLVNINNPVPAQGRGVDLTTSFHGTDVSHNVYIETDYRLYTHKRAIQTPDGWKFILTMENLGKELYNLNDDPGELNNLVDKEPKRAYEMEQMVYKHLKEMNAANGPWTLGCSPAYANQCQ